MKIIFEKEKKGDRCTRIAKRKYDVWPSAYASGAVVKCRQGKIWKGISEEITEEELQEMIAEELAEELNNLEEEKNKPDFKKEKEQGLHGWFSRKGGKDGKGWVDCNTCRTDKETGKKTCKSCGRQEGEKRAKYPACRPKPSDCGSTGKGSDWGKKSESVEIENSNLLEQEEDPKKQADAAIKDAAAVAKAAEQEKRAQVMVNKARPPEQQTSKQADLKSKLEQEKIAKDNLKKAKESAEQISEEKSNFQKEMERKGKGWKIRLLTKGKQPAGSAYPNKAPVERAKSAPPGAGGV
jgi:regulator of protease activity HflC (stomatin/prohibitin superfamily)